MYLHPTSKPPSRTGRGLCRVLPLPDPPLPTGWSPGPRHRADLKRADPQGQFPGPTLSRRENAPGVCRIQHTSHPRRAQRLARHRKGDTPDMARPTKLTPEVHEEIVNAIRVGNFAVISATAAGITEQTYYNWLNRGQTDLADGDTDSLYAKFFESVKQAEAEAEIDTLREMNRDDKWQRRAWWLERRFPKRWGQKNALEVSGPGGGPLAVANTGEAMAELEAFLDERKEHIEAAAMAMADAKE